MGIIGTGSCLPSTVVTCDEMDRALDARPGWTQRATGIRERRRAPAETSLTDLAVGAGREALRAAGVSPGEVRTVIVATVSPDPPVPAVAARVQDRLGATQAFAFDLNAACAGFIFALEVARPLVGVDVERPFVLVIGCDVWSRMTDPLDRQTWPLFGDGAGAVVLGPVKEGGFMATALATDGSLGDYAVGGFSPPLPGRAPDTAGHLFRMRGREISELLLENLPKLVNTVTQMAGVTVADVDYLICHQANPKLVARCAEEAGFAGDRNVNTGEVFGNTVGASVPLGIDAAVQDGRLRQGSLVLLAAFGAGMSWGGTLISWSNPGARVEEP
ncbi:ketoacyl-ACP synthase III [Micromonospora sp. Llam7]|uniref:3-oxoacyl-ACP synthase III family protein n=1 Tax=Micromonospora tarapacensis TaxID=2835305 RepID=UPI001C82AD11|nr:ketoacyl-ACP synthase III [Micromonospora tarapacensis]MBX7269063.1 ketoacyl-ACP synthase III [Micromonospora tarapacensis]